MTQADSVLSTPPINTSANNPEEGLETPQVYLPTDTTAEQLFQAIGRLRKDARDEIDRLVRFLDKTDDYVSRELEDSVDEGPIDDNELEPSLCGVTVGGGSDDRELDRSDDEPNLGSLDRQEDQTQWGLSARNDREEDLSESGIGDATV